MTDPARTFVDQLIRNGMALADICAILIDGLEATDDSPADDHARATLVLEMVTGTVRPAIEAAGPAAVAAATDLIGATLDHVLADLRTAAELAPADGRLC